MIPNVAAAMDLFLPYHAGFFVELGIYPRLEWC